MQTNYLLKYLTILLFGVFSIQSAVSQNYEMGYARKGSTVNLQIDWNANNRGEIQWQRSVDAGATWTNILGATSTSYLFQIQADGLYRAKVLDDAACDPFFLVREISVIDIKLVLNSVSDTFAEFEVTIPDLKGAQIEEYGFCSNFSNMNTLPYTSMRRMAFSEEFPETSIFSLVCPNLRPATSYSVRFYIKTKDGSLLFSPSRLVSTIPGVVFSSEDWKITQTAISPRFEVFGGGIFNNISIKYGTSVNNLKSMSFIKDTDAPKYSGELITGLTPDTDYLFVVEGYFDGELISISKTVRTLADYSSLPVDNTTKPVSRGIRWDSEKKLTRITPEGLAAGYPRLIRISSDSILCSYHGGTPSDSWIHVFTQLSTDNGKTWQAPIKVLDGDSNFGANYWRFTNPELLKLQNGWILMSLTANGKPEKNENCHVMVMISKDHGNTWGDPIIVGRGRTWEPMVIQLPNGELELYVSSEAAWFPESNPLPQEVLFTRSTDMGQTWTTWQRAAYSPNRRDGMPVAVLLQGNKGIAFVIEIVNDGGFGSPSIVKRSLTEEWDSTPWNGVNSDHRYKVEMNAHGGGPHMIQLTTGEIVVQAHVNGRNGIWQTAYPRVVIGDNNAENFSAPVTPLGVPASNEGAYYNSLFQKDEETIWLVMSKTLFSGNTCLKSEIFYMEGAIFER